MGDSNTEPELRQVVLLCLELAHRVRAGGEEDGWCPSLMADGSKHDEKGFGPCATDIRGDQIL